jgi:hypothetical protein
MQKYYSSESARVLRFATVYAVFPSGKKVGVLVASESRVREALSDWKNQQ